LTDAFGQPLRVTSTGAAWEERRQVAPLLGKISRWLKPLISQGITPILEADKGYDADWLRQALLTAKVFPLIPYRKIQGRKAPEMTELCRVFNVSRKRCRRLMLRWERIAKIWTGFATMGLIYTWLKNLFG